MKIVTLLIILLATLWSDRTFAAQEQLAPAAGNEVASGPSLQLKQTIYRGQAAQEGVLTVPESYDSPDGQHISVRFLLFPAKEAAKALPLFILPGGPSWSLRDQSDEFLAHTPVFKVIEKMRAWHDVVIFEQRGGPYATPFLDCSPITGTRAINGTRESYARASYETARQCRDSWLKRGVDLSQYTVLNAARDVEALRQALGYEQINLYGESFGSHWSMAVMHLFPESVSRSFLSGLEGPDHTFDLPGEVVGALKRMAVAAQADDALRASIPRNGLIAGLKDLIDKVERTRPSVAVKGKTGEIETVSLRGDDIRRVVRGVPRATSRVNAENWPSFILSMLEGDLSIAAKAAHKAQTFSPWSGLFQTMDCASGGSQDRRKAMIDEPAISLIGDINLGYETVCAVWRDGDIGQNFRTLAQFRTPTVIFQGDWDISTPKENADQLLPQFDKAKLITVRRGTHFESWRTLFENEVVFNGLEEFFTTGKMDALPANIEIPIAFKPYRKLATNKPQ